MFILRPFAWLFTVLLLVLTAATVFILTFDANRYKTDIVAAVKEKTGRELEISGDIGLSVYPDIALKLGQVKLGNAAGFTGESFAAADSARVTVQLMPLLEQQLRVNEVTLQGLTLNLQRNKSGVTNWADLLPANSSQKDDPVGQVVARLLGNFMIAGVSVKDSQIRWQDAQSGQNMTLAPLNLKTGTLRPGKPVDIHLATRVQQNSPPLDVLLEGSTTALLADNQQDFTLSAFKLNAVAQDKPGAGDTLNAQLTGNVAGNLQTRVLVLPDLQAQVQVPQLGDAQLSGQMKANLADEAVTLAKMQLSTNLQGEKIPGGSLQQQGSGELRLNWGTGNGVVDLPQTSLKLMGQQLDGRLQIHDPLTALVVNGEFKADTLDYPPFQLQKATLGVQMADGILTLTPQGTLFKGGYQGTVQIDTQQTPPRLKMTHNTRGLRTEDLFFALTQDKTVTGALDLTANLTSVAGDALAFKRNLNGTMDVALRDGTIRDAGFAQKTKQVVKLFERESTNALGEKEVAFTTLGGQWQVHQGVFHTDANLLVAPHFQVKGNGDVNIVDESLNFKLRVSEKPKPDKPEGLFAPLHIYGAWKKLSYELELDVLLKTLANRELDQQKAKLQEQFEAEKQKQIDALQQQRDEVKERLKQELQGETDKLQQRLQDQLKNKLNGLF
jgi:AsmA protein